MRRERKIDIIKGLAIILMVLGHSGFAGKKFIYLFHMAVFFMVSGYLFKPNYDEGTRGIIRYIVNKTKSLWLPCFIWNVAYTLLNNTLINLHVYSQTSFVDMGINITGHAYMSMAQMIKNIVKGILMLGRTELGGSFWFLRVLFALSIVYYIVDYILWRLVKRDNIKDILHLMVSGTFVCVGYAAHLHDAKTISVAVVFSSYILYDVGYLIKKYEMMSHFSKIVPCLTGMIILLTCTYIGPPISIGDNNYGNPLYMLVCALCGWMFLCGIATLIERGWAASIVEFVGKRTLVIVIHHFWCFKFVHLVQILIYGYPLEYLASFPDLNGYRGWWIVYLLVGVVLPIALYFLWRMFFNFVFGIIPRKDRNKQVYFERRKS